MKYAYCLLALAFAAAPLPVLAQPQYGNGHYAGQTDAGAQPYNAGPPSGQYGNSQNAQYGNGQYGNGQDDTGKAGGGHRHKHSKLAKYLNPEQAMMLREEIRAQPKAQRRDFRKEQISRLKSMSEGDRQKFQMDLQARWDRLPPDQKNQMEQSVNSRQGGGRNSQ